MVDISTETIGQQATEEKVELINPIDEILAYVANTPYNTNPNILRQMLTALQNSEKNSQ
jgi:hypothetical protein